MQRNSRGKAAAAMVGAVTLTGLLGSCGSSSKTSSSAKTTAAASSTTTGSTAAPAVAPLVTAKKTSKLGTVLADSKGMTLYTLTSNGKAVVCAGPCLKAWPPLDAPAGGATPQGAAGITGLSAVAGAGGTHLVAVTGLPLYHFIQDKDAGDAYGDGIKSFGGVWHVAKTSAEPTKSASGGGDASAAHESTTTETPTTNSSGY